MFLDKRNDENNAPPSSSGFGPFIAIVLAIRFLPTAWAWWKGGDKYLTTGVTPEQFAAEEKRLSNRPI